MRDRSDSTARASASRSACTVDVVVVTPQSRHLAVLGLRGPRSRATVGATIPWAAVRPGEDLRETARRVARAQVGADPAWMEQVGAFGGGTRHPSRSELSVCYVTVVSSVASQRVRPPASWLDGDAVPVLPARQRAMVEAALASIRLRMDSAPIPFRLLPPLFTLSELQQVYELLLTRQLHKASFRRALHASWLVEPTNEWRNEGRGRPAQLFRYAPRRRRGHRRAVRFDLL